MDLTRRAYSLFDVKSVHEDKRIIRGIATTPAVDRVGDIIEPLGVTFKNPMPFLWQHQHDKPIGTVKFDTPTEEGIKFEAELPVIHEPGTLKDRVDEAWQSIKLGLVRAVSIGFRAIEYAFLDEGGIRFLKTEVFELSAVTIPANEQAVMTSIKAMTPEAISLLKKFDTRVDEGIQPAPEPAASGKSVRVVKLDSPARVGAKKPPFVIRKIHPVAMSD